MRDVITPWAFFSLTAITSLGDLPLAKVALNINAHCCISLLLMVNETRVGRKIIGHRGLASESFVHTQV